MTTTTTTTTLLHYYYYNNNNNNYYYYYYYYYYYTTTPLLLLLLYYSYYYYYRTNIMGSAGLSDLVNDTGAPNQPNLRPLQAPILLAIKEWIFTTRLIGNKYRISAHCSINTED